MMIKYLKTLIIFLFICNTNLKAQELNGHKLGEFLYSTSIWTNIEGVSGKLDLNNIDDGRIYMMEFQSFGKYKNESVNKSSLQRFTWGLMNKFNIKFQSIETNDSETLRFVAENGDAEYCINLLIDQNIEGNVFIHFTMGSKALKKLSN